MSFQFTPASSLSPCGLAFGAFGLCALFAGCGAEPTPITSKSTNYEVGEASQSADTSEAAPSLNVADVTPALPGQAPPLRPTPMNQTPAVGASQTDMVQATTEQLLGVIRRLRQQQLKEGTREEVIAEFVNLQAQVIQAAEMLLEQKPGDDAVEEAAGAKIEALMGVSQQGAKDAMDQLHAFIGELEKHPSSRIQDFARQQSFGMLLNGFSEGQVTDSQQVIDAFKKLAEQQPKEGGLLTFGLEVSARFIEKGMNKEGADLMRYTAGLVQPTNDPQLKAAADSLIEQAQFAEVDLRAKLSAVAENEEGAIDAFAKTLGELTSGEKVGATTLQTLMQIASMLEGQHDEAAAKVYDVLEVSLSKAPEGELSGDIKQSIDKYRLRSAIVGKPFVLEGNLLDGTPFDWSQYRGKVVLVDFWATWCTPCLREMPNIRANYEKYREHGFEVVGVNIDDEVQKLKDFSSLQPLPWPSVLSADPSTVGWEHPMVTKNGVAAIPFLVLVDREGTAIALNTRGPALGAKLAELFPDAVPESAPTATEPASAKPAAEKPASENEAAPKTPAAGAPEGTDGASQ